MGCRSGVEVSKQDVEAAVCLGFSSGQGCRSCRSAAPEHVEGRVEAMSKHTNFDTGARSWGSIFTGCHQVAEGFARTIQRPLRELVRPRADFFEHV
jgi:hypothetical protein